MDAAVCLALRGIGSSPWHCCGKAPLQELLCTWWLYEMQGEICECVSFNLTTMKDLSLTDQLQKQ
jgi:hypothetical protein